VSEVYSTLGVLLTTGYSDVAAAETRFPILRKPFEVAALERAVSRALARGQRSDVRVQRSDVRGHK
jgi:FixJ family two-component response regulator